MLAAAYYAGIFAAIFAAANTCRICRAELFLTFAFRHFRYAGYFFDMMMPIGPQHGGADTPYGALADAIRLLLAERAVLSFLKPFLEGHD